MVKITEFINDWNTKYSINNFSFIKEWGNEFHYLKDITTGFMESESEGFLNLLVSYYLEPKEEYLEIGTFGGRSLIAALLNNDSKAQVIDPLPDEFKPGYIKTIKEWFYDAIQKTGVIDRITLHRMKFEDFQGRLPSIGVFLYDGCHEIGSTFKALIQYYKYLSDKAIIIIDDIYLEKWIKEEVLKFIDLHNDVRYFDELPFGKGQAVLLKES